MKKENNLVNSKEDDYQLADYPDAGAVEFPKEIFVAYAVCGKECGNKEFIVDGKHKFVNIAKSKCSVLKSENIFSLKIKSN